jgi:hypothetical protein
MGLTVLSLLARLGLDPWAEAARFVTLPKSAAIACLAGNIAQTPLPPQALAEAQATATRLVRLLPVNNTASVPGFAGRALPPGLASLPQWLPMMLLFCALVIGMGMATSMMAPKPTAAAPASDQTANPTP